MPIPTSVDPFDNEFENDLPLEVYETFPKESSDIS